MTPDVMFTMPQMTLMSVVLPAPFGPSSAKISPWRISRSMSFSALRPEAYVFETRDTETAGCIGTWGTDFGTSRSRNPRGVAGSKGTWFAHETGEKARLSRGHRPARRGATFPDRSARARPPDAAS